VPLLGGRVPCACWHIRSIAYPTLRFHIWAREPDSLVARMLPSGLYATDSTVEPVGSGSPNGWFSVLISHTQPGKDDPVGASAGQPGVAQQRPRGILFGCGGMEVGSSAWDLPGITIGPAVASKFLGLGAFLGLLNPGAP
jgi:hypothetical protein